MEPSQVIDFHTRLQRALSDTHIEWHKSSDGHKYSHNVEFDANNIASTVDWIVTRLPYSARTVHLTYHSDYIYFNHE